MPHVIDKTSDLREFAGSAPAIPLDRANRIVADAAKRLREAVKAAGGHNRVAERSGIASRTLSYLIAGQEPKLSQALAIAISCDVRLEWMVLGVGPMRGDASVLEQIPAETAGGGVQFAMMRDLDFDALLAGLDIAEDLTPHAPPEARISAALRAAEQIRRQNKLGPGLPIDGRRLAKCFGLVEELSGRDRSSRRRLQTALNTYSVLLSDAAAPDEAQDLGPAPGQS